MDNKLKNKIKHTVRYLAVDILESVEKEGAYSNLLLNKVIQSEKLPPKDAGLLTEIVYGVIQRKMTLDYGLSGYIKDPKKQLSWVTNLLRVSAYQMVYLTKVPDHAVLFDAVEIAKAKGHAGVASYVNGVLRNVQRNGLRDWKTISNAKKRISVGASMPKWLVAYFIGKIGIEETEKMAFSLLEDPFVSVRLQSQAMSRETVLEQLQAEGYDVVPSPVSPSGIRIRGGKIVDSPLFKEGILTIQDESSQLVAPVGELEKDFLVLDSCAAPGGKTTHMASYLSASENGKVIALDMYEHKIGLINQNAERLHVSDRIETRVLDAKEAGKAFVPESFDVIYVDAPCSGLGLMRRKPDIKYVKNAQDFLDLHQEQLRILDSVSSLLKKGGRLVYSTCTLTEEENQMTVQTFIENHAEFAIVPVRSDYLDKKSFTPEGFVQIYPHDYGTDGFFISCMVKR
ncbi:16S rRNA (cytosine(967)-C(5))-methyltransferase RsmB [Trichococcus shcherbakoviae]|uniref:16S rRNA (cytosine(967)-C(5))-methyltransferase n=1 Tax=Trichococcus shcherbakoviae subsp. psychrophilus TaxID=2585775 RepID=A0A5C5EAN4_9LACT|nr:16S rRNA (cytosine(967)-C(5))-methyltransferase RsmB [Trichococcus shcherbakoviae]TNV69265.1 16S rRNA (cytosine(967)-C(5))-methyltransferase RsmB [Trichococcus shcherbakoviae subsp. psychrophilus]